MSNSQKPDQTDYKHDIRFDKVPEPTRLPRSGRSAPSSFVLLMLMFAPGLGHMYLGLIRRGLFYFSALPLLIYLTVTMGRFMPLMTIVTGLSIAALYAVSFFEGLMFRREIAAGKEIPDVIPNIGLLLKNKLFVCVIVILAALSLVRHVLSVIPFPVMPVIVIGIIVYLIVSRKDKGGKQ